MIVDYQAEKDQYFDIVLKFHIPHSHGIATPNFSQQTNQPLFGQLKVEMIRVYYEDKIYIDKTT